MLKSKDDHKSSIYTQFKIDTNTNVDEENDLVELLISYAKTCSEHSGLLKEKLQHININRQKYKTLSVNDTNFICLYISSL
jgi:hypothetical protein